MNEDEDEREREVHEAAREVLRRFESDTETEVPAGTFNVLKRLGRAIGRYGDDSDLPTIWDLHGLEPDATGDLSSEEFTKRLRGSDTPVHADEPEGDERGVAAEAGLRPLPEMRPVGESEGADNPPWKPTAENVRRWAEIRKKNGDYDAYTRLVIIARELEDRPPPTDEPVSGEGEDSEVERLLRGWEQAYPESMFPPPPDRPEKGAKLVWVDPDTGEKLSDTFHLDQASAAMGRFMARALRRAFDSDHPAHADEPVSRGENE